MLRDRLKEAFAEAGARGDECAVATLRLVLAALKERDHCARAAGRSEGIDDDQIKALVGAMIVQRHSEIASCEAKGRLDEAGQEAEEIDVLQQFLPPKMSGAEVDAAVDEAIHDLGATRLKDVGRVIAALKKRHGERMDFARAKRHSCARLS